MVNIVVTEWNFKVNLGAERPYKMPKSQVEFTKDFSKESRQGHFYFIICSKKSKAKNLAASFKYKILITFECADFDSKDAAMDGFFNGFAAHNIMWSYFRSYLYDDMIRCGLPRYMLPLVINWKEGVTEIGSLKRNSQ